MFGHGYNSKQETNFSKEQSNRDIPDYHHLGTTNPRQRPLKEKGKTIRDLASRRIQMDWYELPR